MTTRSITSKVTIVVTDAASAPFGKNVQLPQTIVMVEGEDGALYGAGELAATQGASLKITGTSYLNTLIANVPAPTLTLFGGGNLAVTVPPPTFAATGINGSYGILNASEAAPTFTGTGKASGIANFTMQEYSSLALYGGGTLTAVAGLPSLSISGIITDTGVLVMDVPIPTLLIVGKTGTNIGNFYMVEPPLVAIVGRLNAVEPAPTFFASSSPVMQALAAYSMNIKTTETTSYSNFNFQFILRLGFDYFGVNSSGIYQLTGTTDNGTPINANFTTAESYYGTNSHKRNAKIYLDTEDLSYVTPIIDGTTIGKAELTEYGGRKANMPRGYQGKLWQWQIANDNGAPMRIGALEVNFDELSRKIGGFK